LPARCSTLSATAKGASADEIIASQGLQQITDSGALETLIDELLAANPGMVAEFRARQGKGLQRPGRSGDEGDARQGQPATRQ
jgi:Asp-tRNA(Asn)/Glu-tRNA(Gln) amidotransferase B subunit